MPPNTSPDNLPHDPVPRRFINKPFAGFFTMMKVRVKHKIGTLHLELILISLTMMEINLKLMAPQQI